MEVYFFTNDIFTLNSIIMQGGVVDRLKFACRKTDIVRHDKFGSVEPFSTCQ